MKKLMVLLLTLWLFFPGVSLAGSCQCQFDVGGEGTALDCISKGVAKSTTDCSRLNGTKDERAVGTYSNCVYFSNDQCQNSCEVQGLTAGDFQLNTCQADPDCEQLTNGLGIAKCCQSTCYFDAIGLQAYENARVGNRQIQLKKPELEIRIPGVTFSDVRSTLDSKGYIHIPYIGEYIAVLYKFAIVAASILAVIIIIMNGFRIDVSAGGDQKNEAMKKVGQAIIGLVILWGSYTLFYTINPELTQFKALKIKYIEPIPLVDVIKEELAPVGLSIGQNNIPLYKQYDSAWGNNVYGYMGTCDASNSGETMKESNICCTSVREAGCGPTSLAMILKFYGLSVTPADTAAFIGQKGYGRVCNRGTDMNLAISKISEKWQTMGGFSVGKSEALTLARNGYPIIFLCKNCTGQKNDGKTKNYGGHYMVITAYDGKTAQINDPAGTQNTAIVNMTEDQLNNNGGFWYIHP